jgi:putative addiction module component (TIGR02574 family)
MADPARDLETKALGLAPKDRARLAERLLASLEEVADPESETHWLAEAERRLDELESGRAAVVLADEVFRKSRSALR